MTTIKRYKNRKFYDVELSHYVNLSDIEETIKNGIDVRVIDVENGKDITTKTLLQVIANNPSRYENLNLLEIIKAQ